MKKIKFRPGDNNYRWDDVIDSPFLKRNIVTFPFEGVKNPGLVRLKERFYDLFFSNENQSYITRNYPVNINRTKTQKAEYQKDTTLIGNQRQIQFSTSKLIERLITKFEENPQSLFEEAAKMHEICRLEKYSISNIEVFNTIDSWESFIDLLRSLSNNQNTLRFDLLISAVTQYAKLCSD